ncbi:MAG: hypothetical protein K0R47_1515 [Brevibacillus sp.]|jgi:enamine deaminase RidA (YjgF/YER057c/UK114 family)|nr:hypothetical protein [Brevibacillus sp.]
MKRISTVEAPKAVGPYVQAVLAEGTFLYISSLKAPEIAKKEIEANATRKGA